MEKIESCFKKLSASERYRRRFKFVCEQSQANQNQLCEEFKRKLIVQIRGKWD